MRRLRIIIYHAIILTSLLVAGCSKSIPVVDYYEGKMIAARSEQLNNTSVQMNDVLFYIKHAQEKTTTKSDDIVSILPLTDKTQDTLLYIVNYSEGWSILSGDKRTPAVIAYGEEGNISLDSANPAFLSWLNSTAIDIKRIRKSKDCELVFSESGIRKNIMQWGGVNDPRWVDPDIPIDPPDTLTFGQWVLVRTEHYNNLYRQVPHLVAEHWGQDTPYNNYCPQNNEGSHFYVGCAGVAAGALLHHLYRKNNHPTYFSGIPMDSVAVNYHINSSPDSTDVTARYLRAVNDEMGLIVPINYWPGGTFALPSQVSTLFANYGYTCLYDSFDSDIVKSSLQSNKPVIALAFDEWILNLPDITEGHYFIIDGYELLQQVTAKYYAFFAGGAMVPSYDERIEYEYGAVFLSRVKMNWGWESQWTSNTNDGWYYITDSWTTTAGSFDISRHMYYNFSSSN